ncbi:hypothetical protein [Streptomyces lasiicapitis]|uniref:hypothetical protein n=1 Tax=Streptomyces lasiicapitis TaxID=1923961 RepID=UPI0036CA6F21
MSVYVLPDADLAVTVTESIEDHVADLFAEFAAAREAGDGARQAELLDDAYAISPELADEFLGFDYPAAA